MPITTSKNQHKIITKDHLKNALPEYIKSFDDEGKILKDHSSNYLRDKMYDPEKLEENGLRISLKRVVGDLYTYRVEIYIQGIWKVLGNLTYDERDNTISGPISSIDQSKASIIKELVGKHHEFIKQQGQGKEDDFEDIKEELLKLLSGDQLNKGHFVFRPIGSKKTKEEIQYEKEQKRKELDRKDPWRSLMREPLDEKGKDGDKEEKHFISGVHGNFHAISIKHSDGRFSQHKPDDARNVFLDQNHPFHVNIGGSKLQGNTLITPDGTEIKIHHSGLLNVFQEHFNKKQEQPKQSKQQQVKQSGRKVL